MAVAGAEERGQKYMKLLKSRLPLTIAHHKASPGTRGREIDPIP